MKKQKQFAPKKVAGVKEFGRKSASKKGYDSTWTRYTFRFKHHNPTCCACGSDLKINVDHMVPHKGDDELFRKLDNHIPLCHKCHSYCTANFDKFKVPLTEEKMSWINSQRVKFNVTSSIKVLPYYDKSK